MQETWTFDFSHTQNPKEDLESLLIEKEKDLGIFLSYYYKKEGAVAEKVKLKSDVNFSTETTGSFDLEFVLAYLNACLAINEQAMEEMKITFEIDSASEKIKLIGAFLAESGDGRDLDFRFKIQETRLEKEDERPETEVKITLRFFSFQKLRIDL